MKIGLSYDLKDAVKRKAGEPDDVLEEYDSTETVEGLVAAIGDMGHETVKLGGGREFLSRILAEKVDLVFNIAEGRGNYKGREAQVPSVLEMLEIPYSGSDPQCLGICLDKPLTKKLVATAGILTPRWHVVESKGRLQDISWVEFPFPAFVKPAWEGSSKGVRQGSRVDRKGQLDGVITALLEGYRQPVMVEEFIAGEEITVGVIGNSPPVVLGIMRVVPKKKSKDFVYSLEIKRDWENLVEYECPAQLPAPVLRAIQEASLKIFDVLACRDFARLDFRVTEAGEPYFLEINPLAGLNPRSSDLPIMARKVGWTYNALIREIVDSAISRYPECV
ncbi:MAG: D-alanine--D-alanine ligase [Chloroflexi bacterium]|nr:D-alanine--D-alanine ligase [Chloroflexota bacterium]